jgi:hypothetical protein
VVDLIVLFCDVKRKFEDEDPSERGSVYQFRLEESVSGIRLNLNVEEVSTDPTA